MSELASEMSQRPREAPTETRGAAAAGGDGGMGRQSECVR